MNTTLLIVDDEPMILESLRRMLRPKGYTPILTGSGKEALQTLAEKEVGVILSDCRMPEMDGVALLEACRNIRPEAIRIMMTGYASLDSAISAVNRSRIFGYLTKPWTEDSLIGIVSSAFDHFNLKMENRRLLALTHRQNEELTRLNTGLEGLVRRRTAELEDAVREGVLMLAVAAEAKDDDTGEHIMRIQQLTRAICRRMGLPEEQAERIAFFSIMHDVGKIHVPDAILRKPGPLTPPEWQIMKAHTTVGEKILGEKPFYRTARQIARSHHERWNGSGYPDGLAGDAIPLAARLVAVADVFDALTHERPYKPAWPLGKAIDAMVAEKGKHFDPDVLDALLAVLGDDRYGN